MRPNKKNIVLKIKNQEKQTRKEESKNKEKKKRVERRKKKEIR